METNNVLVKKGRCINFGNCKIADTKEIVEVNLGDEFMCPECGGMLVEVKRKPKRILLLISGGIFLILLILGSIFVYINFQKNKLKSVVESVNVITQDSTVIGGENTLKEKVAQLVKEADGLLQNKDYEKAKDAYNAVLAIDPNNLHATQSLLEITKIGVLPSEGGTGGTKSGDNPNPDHPVKISKTLKFDFGYYKGDVVNNLMHGYGTLYFTQDQLISSKDPKKRIAEAGDYISGTWFQGYLDQGQWFSKSGEQKGHIIIGH